MTGMIRVVVGLLITFGAVGGLDDPNANVAVLGSLALLGLVMMASGANAMRK
jgi:hypothetical protein